MHKPIKTIPVDKIKLSVVRVARKIEAIRQTSAAPASSQKRNPPKATTSSSPTP
jgi:hypothetical protein